MEAKKIKVEAEGSIWSVSSVGQCPHGVKSGSRVSRRAPTQECCFIKVAHCLSRASLMIHR